MTTAAKHPATELPQSERVDYLIVIASMAAADGEVAGAEFEKLRAFCRALDLGALEAGQVMAALEGPDEVRIREVTARLKSSQLRFTLMTDLLFMAYADGKFVDSERREIRGLRALVYISEMMAA